MVIICEFEIGKENPLAYLNFKWPFQPLIINSSWNARFTCTFRGHFNPKDSLNYDDTLSSFITTMKIYNIFVHFRLGKELVHIESNQGICIYLLCDWFRHLNLLLRTLTTILLQFNKHLLNMNHTIYVWYNSKVNCIPMALLNCTSSKKN
jgi:hypothetical protein